ncbi:unnamed protein product [Effrenium voratum]|uniref:Uncharacterized protein n=1 Tax=Effrenium voratum TaxID=2562239 RepID=A0AA36I8Z2_9DINO|nr:unnamed protein product [Effrenium voratum]
MAMKLSRSRCADFTLTWTLPLIYRGWAKALGAEKVPEVPRELRAQPTLAWAELLWREEKQRAAQCGRSASLERVFWRVCRPEIVAGLAFGSASGFLTTVARPLLLQALILAQEEGADSRVLGSWAAALCAALLLEGAMSTLNRHAVIGRMGVLFNSAFSGLAHGHSMACATCCLQTAPNVGNLVGNDVVRFQQNLFCMSIIPAASVQFIGGVVILIYTLGLAGVVGLLCMLAMLFLNTRLSVRAKAAEKRNLERSDVRIGLMSQIIHGIRAIKFCAWEESFEDLVVKERARECIPLKQYRVLSQGTVQVGRANPIVGCLFAFVFLALSSRDDPEKFKPADMFAALNVFLALRSALIAIPEGAIYVATTRVAIRRLQDLLDIPCAPQYVTDCKEDPCILVQDASFQWPATGVGDGDGSLQKLVSTRSLAKGELAVQELKVTHGSFVAVVGSVGSGKSSLVQALLGEMPMCPSSKVCLNIKGLAFVPQKAFVLSGTIRENVAFADENERDEALSAALSSASLLEDLTRMPKGLHTEVGERGVVLSGGQQQRLSIARALYQDVDLLVADDPISALDPLVADEVFTALKSFAAGGRTCLVVLNQPWLLPHFDQVLMLSDGQIVEQGSPADLLARDGPLRTFCESSGYDPSAMLCESPRKVSAGVAPGDAGKETAKDTQDVKDLVREEEKLVGTMPLAILLRYIAGMGYGWFALCNLLVVAAYGTLGFVDFWLAHLIEERKEGNSSNDDLNIAIYALAATMVLVFMWMASYCFGEGGVRSSRNLHKECLRCLLHAPVSFFESTPSGRMLSRFSNDIAIVDKEIPKWLDNNWQISANALMLCVQVIIVVNLMFPVMVVAAVLFFMVVVIINRTNRELRRLANAAMAPVLTTVNECVNGRHVVRTMNAADFFKRRLCRHLDEYHSFSLSATAVVNTGGMCSYFICFLISSSASIMIIANKDQYKPSFAALALTYSFYMPYFFQALTQISQLLMNSLTSLERLLQYGNGGILPSEPAWRLEDDPPTWPAKGRVAFEEVSLIYRPGLPKAVDKISFELSPGEKVGIVGRSGAGKSTLMVLLLRLNEATEGRILIDGVDISKIGLGKLRKAVAVVPQDPLLIAGTVQQNLDPFSEHSDFELETILDKVGLDPGLNSSAASSLSHGQRQLLTLGRSLLWPCKVRIFDEPTSNIDAATDQTIQQLLRCPTTFGESTQMTVAHRLQTVVDCDRILVMSAGHLVETGPPRELLASVNSHLAAMARHTGLASQYDEPSCKESL